ncbi:hypothetical protein DAI22_06g050350 [Oryza sativa Japonica Group]|nr:hypothetical protein DAI22_06g050350 [Oryza sativa Japonica Group]
MWASICGRCRCWGLYYCRSPSPRQDEEARNTIEHGIWHPSADVVVEHDAGLVAVAGRAPWSGCGRQQLALVASGEASMTSSAMWALRPTCQRRGQIHQIAAALAPRAPSRNHRDELLSSLRSPLVGEPRNQEPPAPPPPLADWSTNSQAPLTFKTNVNE